MYKRRPPPSDRNPIVHTRGVRRNTGPGRGLLDRGRRLLRRAQGWPPTSPAFGTGPGSSGPPRDRRDRFRKLRELYLGSLGTESGTSVPVQRSPRPAWISGAGPAGAGPKSGTSRAEVGDRERNLPDRAKALRRRGPQTGPGFLGTCPETPAAFPRVLRDFGIGPQESPRTGPKMVGSRSELSNLREASFELQTSSHTRRRWQRLPTRAAHRADSSPMPLKTARLKIPQHLRILLLI
jgi:hypothetical protein